MPCQSQYAATILFFISLGFSKLAIIAFVHNMTPFKLHVNINFGIGITTVLWMVLSVLVVSFQCPLPHPWDRTRGRCINRVSMIRRLLCPNLTLNSSHGGTHFPS
jgi:hypothetical protein